MKKKLFALLLALGFGTAATAAAPNPRSHAWKGLGDLITATAINGGGASFSLTRDKLEGYGTLAVYVDYTRNAATDVIMTCTSSDDNGSTAFAIQSCSVSSGDCTASDATWTKAVAASDTFVHRVDILAYPYITCTFTGTSADGSDTVTVSGWLYAQ